MSSYSYVMTNIGNYPEKYNIVDKNRKIITLRSHDVIDEILSDSIKKHFINYELKADEKNVPVKYGDEIKNTDVNIRYYFDDFASFKSVAIVESVCDGTELDLHGLLNDVFEKIANHEIVNEIDKNNQYKIDYNETADKYTAKCKIAFGNPIIIDQYGIFADEFGKERHFKLTCALPYVLNPRRSFWDAYSYIGNIPAVERTEPDETVTFTHSVPLTGTISGTLTNTAATASALHTHTTVDVDTDVNVLHEPISTNRASTSSNIYGTSTRNLALRGHREQLNIAEDASDVSVSFRNGYDLDSSAAMQNFGSTTNTDATSAASVRELVLENSTYSADINHDHAGTLSADARTMIGASNSYAEALERYNRELPTFNDVYNEIERAYARILQQQRPRVECMNHLVDINI